MLAIPANAVLSGGPSVRIAPHGVAGARTRRVQRTFGLTIVLPPFTTISKSTFLLRIVRRTGTPFRSVVRLGKSEYRGQTGPCRGFPRPSHLRGSEIRNAHAGRGTRATKAATLTVDMNRAYAIESIPIQRLLDRGELAGTPAPERRGSVTVGGFVSGFVGLPRALPSLPSYRPQLSLRSARFSIASAPPKDALPAR
jgi:hypothetical protein